MIKKILLLLTCIIGCTLAAAAGTSVTHTYSGSSNSTDIGLSLEDGLITVSYAKNSGTDAPQYYSNGTAIRFYGGSDNGGNTVTFKCTNDFYVIKEIKLTQTSRSNKMSTDAVGIVQGGGELANINIDAPASYGIKWTGSAKTIVLRNKNASGNVRFNKVEIVYDTASNVPSTTAEPTVNPESSNNCAFPLEVSMSGSGTIYYTISSTEITSSEGYESWNVYDGSNKPSITTDCYFAAVAKNGTNEVSNVVCKHYEQGITPTPNVSSAEGTFLGSIENCTITLEDANISYSINGGAWTEYAPSPVTVPSITSTTTLRCKAQIPGKKESEIVECVYTTKTATPTLSPNGGDITAATTVTLSVAGATSAVTYWYAIANTEPSSESSSWIQLDGNTFEVNSTCKVWVRAQEAGSRMSSSISAQFTKSYPAVSYPTELPEEYRLVTDVSDLHRGDILIIVGKKSGSYYTLGAKSSNNYGVATVGDVSEGIATNLGENANVVVLQDFEETESVTSGNETLNLNLYGLWTTDGASTPAYGYLYASSSSNNYMGLHDTVTNSKLTIQIDSDTGEATMVFRGSYSRNMLLFNSNSSLFSCYASSNNSTSPVYIYKGVSTPKLQAPVISGPETAFTGSATVTVAAPEGVTYPAGAKIYYKLGAQETAAPAAPYTGWTEYTEALTLSATTGVNAFVLSPSDDYRSSSVAYKEFTQAQTAETLISFSATNLESGSEDTFRDNTTVTITAEGAEVRYSTDGGTTWSAYAASPVTVSFSETTTIQAQARETGKAESDVVSVTFKKWSVDATYVKITSASDLQEGDKFLLVGYGNTVKYKAMSRTQGKNNRDSYSVTVSDENKITGVNKDEIQVITLVSAGKHTDNVTDLWAFYVEYKDAENNENTGYLYAAGTSNIGTNYMRTSGTLIDNAKAKITFESGNAKIEFVNNTKTPLLRFNPSIFSCYASSTTTGSNPMIFKEIPSVSSTPVVTLSNTAKPYQVDGSDFYYDANVSMSANDGASIYYTETEVTSEDLPEVFETEGVVAAGWTKYTAPFSITESKEYWVVAKENDLPVSEIAHAAYTLKQYDGDHINPYTTGVVTATGAFDKQIGAKGAQYKGYATKGQSTAMDTEPSVPYMSFKKDEGNGVGTVTTVSGGVAQRIVVKVNKATTVGTSSAKRGIEVYGKNSPYTATTDLYADNSKGTLIGSFLYENNEILVYEFLPTDAYEYIAIVPSHSNAIYLDEIQIVWGDDVLVPEPSVSFENALWHFDVQDNVIMTPTVEGDEVWYTTNAAKKDAFSTESGSGWTQYTTPIPVTNTTIFYAVEYRPSTGKHSTVLTADMVKLPAPRGGVDELTAERLGLTTANPNFRHQFGYDATLNPETTLPYDNDENWTGAIWLGNASVKDGSIRLDCRYDNGIITTSTGGYAKRVTIEWDAVNTKGSPVFDIYGTNTEVNDIARMDGAEPRCMLAFADRDKNNVSEWTFNGDFKYLGFNSRNVTENGADDIYIKKITIEWSTDQSLKYSDRPSISMAGGLNHFDQEGVITATMPDTAPEGTIIRYKIQQSYSTDLDGDPVLSASQDPDDGTWLTYTGPITIVKTSTLRFSAKEPGKAWSSFVIGRYICYDLAQGGLDVLNEQTMDLEHVSASTYEDIYKRTFDSGTIWGGNIKVQNYTPVGGEQVKYMTFRNNSETFSGLVTTSTGGKLDYVLVDWGDYPSQNANSALEIYASNNQPFWTSGMYDASKEPVAVASYANRVTDENDPDYGKTRVYFPRNYRYIGIKAQTVNAIVKEIAVNWLTEDDLIAPLFGEVSDEDGTVTLSQPEGNRPGNDIDIYYLEALNFTLEEAREIFEDQDNYDDGTIKKYTGPFPVWEDGYYYAAATEFDEVNNDVKVGGIAMVYLESKFVVDELTAASLGIGNGSAPYYSSHTSGARFKTNANQSSGNIFLEQRTQFIHSVKSPGQVARIDIDYKRGRASQTDIYLSQWYMDWNSTDGVFNGDYSGSSVGATATSLDTHKSYEFDLHRTDYRFLGMSTDETKSEIEKIKVYWLPREMNDGSDPTGDWRFMSGDMTVNEVLQTGREYILVVSPGTFAETDTPLRVMGHRNGTERSTGAAAETITELGNMIYLESEDAISPVRLEAGVSEGTYAFRFKNQYDRYDDPEPEHESGQYLAIQKVTKISAGETVVSWDMVTSPVKQHTETISTDLYITRNANDANKWDIVFKAVEDAGGANKNLRANTSTSQGVSTTRFKNYGNSEALPSLYRKIDLDTEAEKPYFTPEAGTDAYAFRMKCKDPMADVYYLTDEDFTDDNKLLLLPNGSNLADFDIANITNGDIFALAEIITEFQGVDRIVENGQAVAVPEDNKEHTYYMIAHRKQLGKDYYSALVVGTYTNPNREASTIVDNLNDSHLVVEGADRYRLFDKYVEASNARYAMVVNRNRTNHSLQISGNAVLGKKYYPGIITLVSGGELKSITVTWDAPEVEPEEGTSTDQTNNLVSLDVYGSLTPFDVLLEIPEQTAGESGETVDGPQVIDESEETGEGSEETEDPNIKNFGYIKTIGNKIGNIQFERSNFEDGTTEFVTKWEVPAGTVDYPYIAILGHDNRAAFMHNLAFEWRPRYYDIQDFMLQESTINVPFEGTVHVSRKFKDAKDNCHLTYVHEVNPGYLDRALLVKTANEVGVAPNEHFHVSEGNKLYAHYETFNYRDIANRVEAQPSRRRAPGMAPALVGDESDPNLNLGILVPEAESNIAKGSAENATSDATKVSLSLQESLGNSIPVHSLITLPEARVYEDEDGNFIAAAYDSETGNEELTFILDEDFKKKIAEDTYQRVKVNDSNDEDLVPAVDAEAIHTGNIYDIVGYVSSNSAPYHLSYVDGTQCETVAPNVNYYPIKSSDDAEGTDYFDFDLDADTGRPSGDDARDVEYYYVIYSRKAWCDLYGNNLEGLTALAATLPDPDPEEYSDPQSSRKNVIRRENASEPYVNPDISTENYQGLTDDVFTDYNGNVESTQLYDSDNVPTAQSPTVLKAVAVKKGYLVSPVVTNVQVSVYPTEVEEVFGDADATGDVFTIDGVCILRGAVFSDLQDLTPGIYIFKGKKILVK